MRIPGPCRSFGAALVLGTSSALFGACAATVPATPRITPGVAAAPRQVNVIMKDYLYVPAIVDLVPGETIQLNVINGGLETHELVLGPAAVQDAWAAAERPAANPPPGPTPRVSVAPEVSGIRIVEASGASQTVIYTVPDDLSVQLLLQCHIADHLERGMAAAVRFVGPGGVILTPPPGASPAAPSASSPPGPTQGATRP